MSCCSGYPRLLPATERRSRYPCASIEMCYLYNPKNLSSRGAWATEKTPSCFVQVILLVPLQHSTTRRRRHVSLQLQAFATEKPPARYVGGGEGYSGNPGYSSAVHSVLAISGTLRAQACFGLTFGRPGVDWDGHWQGWLQDKEFLDQRNVTNWIYITGAVFYNQCSTKMSQKPFSPRYCAVDQDHLFAPNCGELFQLTEKSFPERFSCRTCMHTTAKSVHLRDQIWWRRSLRATCPCSCGTESRMRWCPLTMLALYGKEQRPGQWPCQHVFLHIVWWLLVQLICLSWFHILKLCCFNLVSY